MTTEKRVTPEELIHVLSDLFPGKITNTRVERRTAGVQKNEYVTIWLKVDRLTLKPVIKHLITIQFPHLAVVSGNDRGDVIELVYHLSLFYGTPKGEISLNIAVDLPKTDPSIETISDLIPGAVITEREKQEMLGVIVEGIPDKRRLFLPDDFPEGVYPWRKDETGPKSLVRNLHEETP